MWAEASVGDYKHAKISDRQGVAGDRGDRNVREVGQKEQAPGEGRAKDGTDEAVFRVLLWPAGAAMRRTLGLPQQDFHISLGRLVP